MKGSKEKVVNNIMFEIDNCRFPQVAFYFITEEQLLNFLDKESSIGTHHYLRKKIQDGKVRLMSSHALSHEKIDVLC